MLTSVVLLDKSVLELMCVLILLEFIVSRFFKSFGLIILVPGVTKECFLEALKYLKTSKHITPFKIKGCSCQN